MPETDTGLELNALANLTADLKLNLAISEALATHPGRGVIDDRNIVQRSCHSLFLNHVLQNLERIFYCYGLNFNNTGEQYHAILFRWSGLVIAECRRLRQFPKLFPKDKGYVSFFQPASRLIVQIIRAMDIVEDYRNSWVIAREQEYESWRPSFEPNLMPWEQFLSKGMPGVKVPFSSCLSPGQEQWDFSVFGSARDSYQQCIPAGGVAILRRWIEHAREQVDWFTARVFYTSGSIEGKQEADGFLREFDSNCPDLARKFEGVSIEDNHIIGQTLFAHFSEENVPQSYKLRQDPKLSFVELEEFANQVIGVEDVASDPNFDDYFQMVIVATEI